ncbi:MAG TPA: SdrD B-like domain-containing protein, partial [Herpetosiphonaceae bacterium]
TLVDSTGRVIATTTTDASGNYTFLDIPAGNYTVRVPDQPALSGYDLTSGLDYTPVTVAGTNISNISFGYSRTPQTGSIGNLVWFDSDRDGVRDGGEDGISNVRVTLFSAGADGVFGTGDDATIGSTFTDQHGQYRFANLPSGIYRVDLDNTTLPGGGTGFVATTGTSDPTVAINLSEGEIFERANFGYGSAAGTSLLGDRIWFDSDGDGAQDDGEPGIPGVQLTITGPGGPFVATTDADGTWIVPNLAPGSYTVTVNVATLPAGINPTPTNPGAASRTYTLVAGRDILYSDFGFNGGPARGSIGDFIWNDANGDGLQTAGEPGIAGVTVNLIGPGPDGTFGTADDVILASTISSDTGAYSFTGLPVGPTALYRVQVTDNNSVLRGLNSTTPAVTTTTINLTVGAPNNTATDLGYQAGSVAAGSVVGNQIWRDVNGNGVLDAGEPGMEGVTLNLWRDVDGNGVINPTVDNLVRTTATDSRGYYEFAGLPLGSYIVDVTDTRGILAGYTKTAGAANTDNNSQADPYAFTLTAGSPNNNAADFGYRATTPFAINGTVFKDLNQNAALDGTESRFSRVTVYLYSDLDGDGVIDPGEPLIGTTVTTGALGNYSFPGLPNGRYVVAVDANASGLAGTYQTTQTATGGVQPVFINNATMNNVNFGFFAPDAPTQIRLVSFTATRQSDGTVLVVWETAVEFNTTGFHILRATAGTRDQAAQQNAALIPAQGDVSGFRYQWVDTNAPDTAAYSYWLQEVETDGDLAEYGPANVLGAVQFKVFAPLTFR